jgi:hypothetical protein
MSIAEIVLAGNKLRQKRHGNERYKHRRSHAFNAKHAARDGAWMACRGSSSITLPLLMEVRQGKLGCSEGESPSRLMEESVIRTKEKNGKG